jgi:Fis family transcriptional regulator
MRPICPVSKRKNYSVAKKISKKRTTASVNRTESKNKTTLKVQSRNRLLCDFTEDALRSYFKNLNGHKPAHIYKLVMGEVEPPLLASIMEYTKGNQTLASEILGLNRATLRKKLKQYGLNT